MKRYRLFLIFLNLILVLGYFNYSVIRKEKLLETGELILLELTPVDPRSLMQGDYMDLRYAVSQDVMPESIARRGFCVITLNDGVGQKVRFQERPVPLNEGEYLIRYTSDGWRVNIGAESFFFQEGQAAKYENAKYGGVKVDKDGNSILVGLFGEDKELIR